MAVVLLAAATPFAAPAQSPDALLRRVANQADSRAQGVNNYTLELGGLESRVTLYTYRRTPSSPFDVQFAAAGELASSKTDLGFADLFVLMLQDRRFPSPITYAGVTEIDETPVHVVTSTVVRPARDVGSIARASVTVYYDTTTLLPHRVQWITGYTDGTTIESQVDYSDYRTVRGMQIAFHRRMVVRGRRSRMSTAEIASLRKHVDGLQATFSRLSDAEKIRAGKIIETAERLLNQDEVVWDLTVTSAVVNRGLPMGVPLRRLGPPIAPTGR